MVYDQTTAEMPTILCHDFAAVALRGNYPMDLESSIVLQQQQQQSQMCVWERSFALEWFVSSRHKGVTVPALRQVVVGAETKVELEEASE